MALNLVSGLMGAGKSYCAVNFFMLDELKNGSRHIWTNLPIHPDRIADLICGRQKAKRPAILERLHVLEDRMEVVKGEDGLPLMFNGKPVEAHMVRQFWRFTSPNSLIIVDESADLWNARNWKETHKAQVDGLEEGELQSYINHHRHYKDDLYVLCQDIDDIDKQIREKFAYHYLIRNSLEENMFEWHMLKGLKWPTQFFRIEQYVRKKKEPQDTFQVWPNKKGFALYDSFSRSVRLPGKKLPPEDAASSNYGQSYFVRMRLWFKRGKVLGFLGLCAVLTVAAGAWVFDGLMHADSSVMEGLLGEVRPVSGEVIRKEDTSPAAVASPPPPAAVASPAAPIDTRTMAKPAPTVDPVPVPVTPRIVMAVPGCFWDSNRKPYRKGAKYEGKTVLAITVDAVLFTDGTSQQFEF